ncbi:zinc-binding protein A33 [Osmerus eperlanus]|uniref:zinc-binding protein A33 n=1 Tax=Osmerus eperlanus TaxID=29151 RepID=UPI002E13332B
MSHCEMDGPLALELSCPICLQLFLEPVSLPCGHIYCMACLQKAVDADHHRCPECQTEYQGTKDLMKNFKMCSIIERYKATAGSRPTNIEPMSDTDYTVTPQVVHQVAVATNPSNFDSSRCPEKRQQDSDLGGKQAFHIAGPLSSSSLNNELDNPKAKTEMDELKDKLASQLAELTHKLQMSEEHLKKEEVREMEVKAHNSQLRRRTARQLEQIMELMLNYSEGVTNLIEVELKPIEEGMESRRKQAVEVTKHLSEAHFQAESLLTEKDETVFNTELRMVLPRIAELMAQPLKNWDGNLESQINPDRVCSELERKNVELRIGLGAAQRSIRNILNPSELTFDLETAHPNLVLSEDLKTVTYSAVKQAYPLLQQRFSSFLQVLSSQSFYGGEHCWEVELDGAPWIVGVCYSSKLARSGLASALESSRSSWCLMWVDNLLRAFEQGNDVPLKRTTMLRRMEIRLSFKTKRLSFYHVSPCSGKTHMYTFKANLTEPVHLAYRMMAGQPKAHITVCS